MTYIGPNPTISGYVRSRGEALRVIAGASSGGAALVVRNDSGIQKPEGLPRKESSSPQLGNTQDVALRGDESPTASSPATRGATCRCFLWRNPDQLTLFLKKELECRWAPDLGHPA